MRPLSEPSERTEFDAPALKMAAIRSSPRRRDQGDQAIDALFQGLRRRSPTRRKSLRRSPRSRSPSDWTNCAPSPSSSRRSSSMRAVMAPVHVAAAFGQQRFETGDRGRRRRAGTIRDWAAELAVERIGSCRQREAELPDYARATRPSSLATPLDRAPWDRVAMALDHVGEAGRAGRHRALDRLAMDRSRCLPRRSRRRSTAYRGSPRDAMRRCLRDWPCLCDSAPWYRLAMDSDETFDIGCARWRAQPWIASRWKPRRCFRGSPCRRERGPWIASRWAATMPSRFAVPAASEV